MKTAILYTIFAVIATIINIAGQDMSIRVYDDAHSVVLSVLVGTIVGLIVKYVLDKKYIFQYQTISIAHDTRTFVTYTVMGLITTAIFWCSEITFDAIFQSKEMRYLGGVIGLAIGYYIKYQLDKRYVFKLD